MILWVIVVLFPLPPQLTQVLEGSLSRDAKAVLVVTAHGGHSQRDVTLQALRFGAGVSACVLPAHAATATHTQPVMKTQMRTHTRPRSAAPGPRFR